MSRPAPLAGVSTASSDDVAGRVLPVNPHLREVLPWPGLRRGTTIAVGSMSLLFALLAPVTAAGGWAAVVGVPELSVLAAAEAGVAVERMPLVPRPGIELATVVAALVDGVDLVAFTAPRSLSRAEQRTLTARARQRGAVLLPLGPWPSADVALRCTSGRWLGLDAGHGHLVEREVEIHASGRGAAARPRSTRVRLPGPGGPLAPVTGAEGARRLGVVRNGCA
ncbi:hypothetical protein [Allokutzneria oryzae]|uniref:Uncharacterized protein n=1 Tax=Allokutzneria oryzae TaxID=1378989 RepID=A0ABV6A3Q6_9PSEU